MDEYARLRAEQAIIRVVQTYCRLLDSGRIELYDHVFTDDAVFENQGPPGYAPSRHQGRAAICATMALYPTLPPPQKKHIAAAPIIEVRGEKAAAETSWVSLYSEGAQPYVNAFGIYFDEFVYVRDRWLIRYRLVRIEAIRPH